MSDALFVNKFLSPFNELVAYEYLWSKQGSSFAKMAKILSLKKIRPTQVLEQESLFENPKVVEIQLFLKKQLGNFSVIFKENAQYPQKLLASKHPIDMFYYRGDLGLAEVPCISIVGARKMTENGKSRTERLTRALANDFIIVSGLAAGIDTVALSTAISQGKKVIGVIGTPINQYYPKENKPLQEEIAKKHLLISQVPLYKYEVQPFTSKKLYFPERNITMAALSDATIIVEASETSGSHTQAKACLEQGKKLFILNSCFENPSITWPKKYLEKGAYRIREVKEILSILQERQ